MGRRFMILAGGAALLAASFAPSHAVGPTGVACVISGTATLTPPVTTKATQTHYSFSGTLAPCRSTDSTLKTGTVTASGDGKLSCASGSSVGSGLVNWSNGKASSVTFTTKDAGSAVVVQGKVTGGEFAGTAATQGVAGVLSFITTNAAACAKAGLGTLNFKGIVGAGSAK